MWRPGNAALSRLEKHNRVARPAESARRPGRKFSRGGGLLEWVLTMRRDGTREG